MNYITKAIKYFFQKSARCNSQEMHLISSKSFNMPQKHSEDPVFYDDKPSNFLEDIQEYIELSKIESFIYQSRILSLYDCNDFMTMYCLQTKRVKPFFLTKNPVNREYKEFAKSSMLNYVKLFLQAHDAMKTYEDLQQLLLMHFPDSVTALKSDPILLSKTGLKQMCSTSIRLYDIFMLTNCPMTYNYLMLDLEDRKHGLNRIINILKNFTRIMRCRLHAVGYVDEE
jgi:hypothetical protein